MKLKFLCAVLFAAFSAQSCGTVPVVLHEPQSIVLRSDGRTENWKLRVTSGRAEFTDYFKRFRSRVTALSAADWEALRKIASGIKWEEVRGEYGYNVPDGRTRTIVVTCREHSHSIVLLPVSPAAGPWDDEAPMLRELLSLWAECLEVGAPTSAR